MSVWVLECYPPLNQDGSEKIKPFAVGKKIYTKMEVTKDHHLCQNCLEAAINQHIKWHKWI